MHDIRTKKIQPHKSLKAVPGQHPHEPLAIDLFSGCGGLTLGLKRAKFKVIGAIEIDNLAAETYRMNHRGVKLWSEDIRNVSVADVRKRLNLRKGSLDLLAGCPPCQGFSTVRTLNGSQQVDDKRNDLLFEFLRFAKELLPKTIMMENVPGLANDARLKTFCNELQALGYQCKHYIVDAANYGVPQRRRRFILLAARNGLLRLASPSLKRRTVRQTIELLPIAGKSKDPLHDLPESRSARILEMITLIPENGGSRSDLGEEWKLECHKKCDGFKDIYGRMKWDDVSPTLTGCCFNPSKGRFLHPKQHRAITMREAALLQTFPRQYHFSLKRGKGAVAVMIGNALPPELIRRHAESIARHLQSRRTAPAQTYRLHARNS